MFTLNIYLDYYTTTTCHATFKVSDKNHCPYCKRYFNKDEYMKHIELCNKVAECGTQIKKKAKPW